MIFLLGVLWAQEPQEISVADQEVVNYLLEKHADTPQNTPTQGSVLPPSLQEDYDRKVGKSKEAGKTSSAPPTTNFPQMGMPWWWGVLFAALILGFLRFFTQKKKDQIGSLKIHSRSFFGQEGSVAVVEVKDANQNSRLFLLGLHGKGTPRFLADLSEPIPFPELDANPIPVVRQRPSAVSVPKTKKKAKAKSSPKQKKREVESRIVEREEQHEKEALVEHILRIKESKTIAEPAQKESVKKQDKWTEGFHEVLRK